MKTAQSLRCLLLAAVYLAPLATAQVPSDPSPNPALERVLGQMDTAASTFRTIEGNVVWDQYQKVVDEHEDPKRKGLFPPRRK